jgi:serine protease AprX
MLAPPMSSPADLPARSRHEELRGWIFGEGDARRFTQDSAVLPRVWLEYAQAPEEPQDLLLTPEARSSAGELARAIDDASADRGAVRLAYNESYVVARLTLRELVRVVVPLSDWWREDIGEESIEDLGAWVEAQREPLRLELADRAVPIGHVGPRGELIWFVGLVGRVAQRPDDDSAADVEDVISAAAELLAGVSTVRSDRRAPLWRVNPNRVARTTLLRSREAIKADAAGRLFDIKCDTLCWAVIDAGVDATHPAFGRRDPVSGALVQPGSAAHSRVRCTYDFTRLRPLMAGELPTTPAVQAALEQFEQRLVLGRAIDWDALAPLLRVPHDAGYQPPHGEHGTHVAGILGGDWRAGDAGMPFDHDLRGVCPDIELFDLRVFDRANRGEEFPITAALQFVRHLNAHSDLQVIHGVNLSLAIDHDIRNYACGRTPVCDECNRVVGSGVVVVVAAGNEGRAQYTSEDGVSDGYRTTSITDPGNAARVLTVGATHRFAPHTYGVSYFSSRGPTGDGRRKPDLVAPGERILAPVPSGDAKFKDGTSQAAPHVSGAAALLMARHEELRAQPERVKEVLCASATDLGREHYFQGAGMLDVLRAIQEV